MSHFLEFNCTLKRRKIFKFFFIGLEHFYCVVCTKPTIQIDQIYELRFYLNFTVLIVYIDTIVNK